jgi:hypothetical protein
MGNTMQSFIVTVLTAAVTASVVTYLLPAQQRVEDSRSVTLPMISEHSRDAENSNQKQKFQSNTEMLIQLQNKQEYFERQLNKINNNIRTDNNSNRENKLASKQYYATDEADLDANVDVDTEEDAFENFETSFSNEANSAEWQALMSDSFSKQEELLTQLNIDSIAITQQDCSSDSCLIEYTYTDEEVMNKVKPILITEYTSQVAFKDVELDGEKKVIAIFRR